MKLLRYIVFVAFILIAQAVCAAPADRIVVADLQLNVENGDEIITIYTNAPVSYRAFTLDNPARFVVDLPPFNWHVSAAKVSHYNGRLIRNIRYARFDRETSRIVFDLNDNIAFTDNNTGRDKTKILRFTLHAEAGNHENNKRGSHNSLYSAATGFKAIPIPVVKPDPLQSWKKPLIIIDAGHGGKDSGAIGRKHTKEKDITLLYARELAAALNNSGKFRAKLTRHDDRFILLRERIKIARKLGGDIFLSIHADSAPTIRARGLSIYTLSEEASDEEAAALAARENKVDILAGVDLSHEDKDVANILIDLAQRDTKNKSIMLADSLVSALRGNIKLLPNTHRFAGFAVLKAPDIPSALIEIGFLSNPKEEQLIKTAHYRQKVIKYLIQGIEDYIEQHK